MSRTQIIKIAEQKSDIDKNGKINDEWIKYFIREKAKTTSDINWQSEVRQLIIKAKIEHAFELSLSKHPQNPILILYSSEYNYYKEGVTKGLIDPYNNVIRNQIVHRLIGFINDI